MVLYCFLKTTTQTHLPSLNRFWKWTICSLLLVSQDPFGKLTIEHKRWEHQRAIFTQWEEGWSPDVWPAGERIGNTFLESSLAIWIESLKNRPRPLMSKWAPSRETALAGDICPRHVPRDPAIPLKGIYSINGRTSTWSIWCIRKDVLPGTAPIAKTGNQPKTISRELIVAHP